MAEGVDLDQGFYRRATLTGFMAILMWSLLAALTVATGAVPPFQLAAVCFAIGGALGLIWTSIRGELRLLTGQPLSVWLHGVGGIFGYHFLYFTALRHGSPAEVSLIAYLWPLLIVLFSTALPGHRLKVHHVVGAVLGFVGVAVIVLGRGRGLIITEPVGYLAIWLPALARSSGLLTRSAIEFFQKYLPVLSLGSVWSAAFWPESAICCSSRPCGPRQRSPGGPCWG